MEARSLGFSSVVSYHQSKYGCGVARFSMMLAERLRIPFRGFNDPWGPHPLLSLKWTEIGDGWHVLKERLQAPSPYSVFWHDAGSEWVTDGAEVVFYADPSLGSPGLWCPSLITPRRNPVRLFSLGMAHKVQTEKFRRVRELLDAAGLPFHLRVSVGLHEGTSLDGAEQHFDALREILGPENVTILGILSDDAVSEELAKADYVLAFFEQGLRANNTTVHAALTHRRPVVTNHDDGTPEFLQRVTMDVDSPLWIQWLQGSIHPYSWDGLIQEMEKVCASSPSTVAR